MKNKIWKFTLPVILATLLAGNAISPATAAESYDITDAQDTLNAYLPSSAFADAEESENTIEISVNPDGNSVIEPGIAPTLTQPPTSGTMSQSNTPTEDLPEAEIQPVQLALDQDVDLTNEDNGISTFVNDDETQAQYVIPTDSGTQIITVQTVEPETFEHFFPIELDGGESAVPTINADGTALVSDSYGIPVGTLSAPWAIDAAGKFIDTKFLVQDGILSQWVDYNDPDIIYPVLSDPNWTYSLNWKIGPTSKVNSTKVRNAFYDCFSCNFAADPLLTGAPRNMPSYGQVVPLTLGGLGNFTVKKGSEWNIPLRNNFGWQFIAEPGHIDGAGSTITFDYYNRTTDGQFIQVVSAYIKNDFILGNGTYTLAASRTWSYVAYSLTATIIGPGPLPSPEPTP